MSRGTQGLRDALILDRRLQHHAVGELIDHGALDFLPWRLAGRIVVAAVLLRARRGARQLGVGDQHVGRAFVEIDAHAVAGLEQRKPAAGGGFRRGVEDRRRADVPDWRPSPMQGSAVTPRLISAAGGCMLTTSAEPGIADRADAAHEQDGVFVDAERRIVDAAVIVLRPVEHHSPALERVRIFGSLR